MIWSALKLLYVIENLPAQDRSKSHRQLFHTGHHTLRTLTHWHILEYPWQKWRKVRERVSLMDDKRKTNINLKQVGAQKIIFWQQKQPL